jgi:hypothetical protein
LQILANKIDNLLERKVDEYTFESKNQSVKVFEVCANSDDTINKAFDYAVE